MLRYTILKWVFLDFMFSWRPKKNMFTVQTPLILKLKQFPNAELRDELLQTN